MMRDKNQQCAYVYKFSLIAFVIVLLLPILLWCMASNPYIPVRPVGHTHSIHASDTGAWLQGGGQEDNGLLFLNTPHVSKKTSCSIRNLHSFMYKDVALSGLTSNMYTFRNSCHKESFLFIFSKDENEIIRFTE